MIILNEPGITYDDVVIVPRFNLVGSRNDVDLKTKFSRNIEIDIPIVSANMDTVTEFDMAVAMSDLGGIGVINRNMSKEEHIYNYDLFAAAGIKNPVLSIGTRSKFKTMIKEFIEIGLMDFYKAVVIDIAHAHSIHALDTYRYVSDLLHDSGYGEKVDIIVGNIATGEAALSFCMPYKGRTISGLKVGIGPGSLCTTRVVTGHGYPQLSAIIETSRVASKYDVPVIADGGIKNSGDIVKALAAGASTVMIGSLLSDTVEAPGERVTIDGKEYKSYRGMASKDASTSQYHSVSPEGESVYVPYFHKTTKQVIDKLVHGIKSGFTYSGSSNIDELKAKAIFKMVSLASYYEGTPHGLKDNIKLNR